MRPLKPYRKLKRRQSSWKHQSAWQKCWKQPSTTAATLTGLKKSLIVSVPEKGGLPVRYNRNKITSQKLFFSIQKPCGIGEKVASSLRHLCLWQARQIKESMSVWYYLYRTARWGIGTVNLALNLAHLHLLFCSFCLLRDHLTSTCASLSTPSTPMAAERAGSSSARGIWTTGWTFDGYGSIFKTYKFLSLTCDLHLLHFKVCNDYQTSHDG